MSNVPKLKKQAAEFELKKQFDKALAIYVKLLDDFETNAAELDVALFNRVGDLHLRQGNVADAVDYYERAIDKYADGGYFSNAIALCNKVLRHSPGRTAVYYKLGKISAQKGFKADAKQNFLEYAERMQKAGNMDEAFRALTEFADLCPDQDDIRLMLAEQLTKAGRKDDAVEQLQTLYERYEGEGRGSEAQAALTRMRTIDPNVQPRSGGKARQSSAGDLIFLDLGEPSPPRRKSAAMAAMPETPPAPAAQVPEPGAVVPAKAAPDAVVPAKAGTHVPDPESSRPTIPVERQRSDTPLVIETTAAPNADDLGNAHFTPQLGGITRVDDGAITLDDAEPSIPLLDIEPTGLGFADEPAPDPLASLPLIGLTPTSIDAVAPPEAPRATPSAPSHMATPAGPPLEFISLDDEPPLAAAPAPQPADDLLDLTIDLGTPAQPAVAIPSPTPTPAAETPKPPVAATQPIAPPPGIAPRNSVAIPGLPAFDIVTPLSGPVVEAEEPPAAAPRSSTISAALSVEVLRASVEDAPDDWTRRRDLGEAMLDAGERTGGMTELEAAMTGAERTGDLELASSIAEELARMEPDAVRHQQKRVELAFRRNDKGRLVEAYLSLAEALVHSDQSEKARTVYKRVLELHADEPRAQAALDAMRVDTPPTPAPAEHQKTPAVPATRRSSPGAAPATPVTPPPVNDTGFVNLGDWLREDEAPKDTRMVVSEDQPTGDENADFADMLKKFKQGVEQNVEAEDYQSHYDLAIAFKEMGLLDEAIHEFQKALGSPSNRIPTYEALGQCFLDKDQPRMAWNILQRAISESKGSSDDGLVGVLYLLGRAAEGQGRTQDALDFYQRVFVIDIQFRDINERMNALDTASR